MDKYRDWEPATLCNIHANDDGMLLFTCFNCGAEEIFRPDHYEKTTKKEAILIREKAKILDELDKNNNYGN